MFAMILAAGRGERMRPLTDSLPKPLLKVNNKPLIEYHLEKLKETAINKVVINHAWLGHLIPQSLGNGCQWGLTIDYSNEGDNALETAGGIKKVLKHYDDDYFIVINGDVWTDFDFSLLPNSLPCGVLAHLILVNNPVQHPKGDFSFDDQGSSNSTLKNQGAEQFTFSGIAIYHRDFFKAIDNGVAALGPILRQHVEKKMVTGELYQGQWFDIGTVQRLTALDNQLKNNI